MSFGCKILDSTLRGGLLLPGINEIAGESGSGKTQIALQLCLIAQLKEENGGMQGGIHCSDFQFHSNLLRIKKVKLRKSTEQRLCNWFSVEVFIT